MEVEGTVVDVVVVAFFLDKQKRRGRGVDVVVDDKEEGTPCTKPVVNRTGALAEEGENAATAADNNSADKGERVEVVVVVVVVVEVDERGADVVVEVVVVVVDDDTDFVVVSDDDEEGGRAVVVVVVDDDRDVDEGEEDDSRTVATEEGDAPIPSAAPKSTTARRLTADDNRGLPSEEREGSFPTTGGRTFSSLISPSSSSEEGS